MDNELFGEMHEQEENGLYGKRHERELLGLSNVVQRTFLFTGIYEGEKFKIKVTERDRESAIAYFEINYPWHTWRQTEEVS